MTEKPRGELRSVGRFVLERVLGEGGSGIVYLGYDPFLECQRAIKVPHLAVMASSRNLARFRGEAAKAALIDHPHVVRVVEADALGPLCYVVMELCTGGSLYEWLARRPVEQSISPRWAAELMVGVVSGVQRIHEEGLLHRDLKPGNIMLERTGGTEDQPHFLPKVGDFGLAKHLDPEDPRRREALTHAGELVGTYQYMSPEQAKAVEGLTEHSDIYALGVILYELLTRRRPFEGTTAQEILLKIIHQDPVAPRALRPEIPRDLETITLKCLQNEPSRRYASTADLRRDLQCFLDGRGIQARPPSQAQRVGAWTRRHRLSMLTGGATFGVSFGLVAVLLLGSGGFDRVADTEAQIKEARRIEERARDDARTKSLAAELKRRAFCDRIATADRERRSGSLRMAQASLLRLDDESQGQASKDFAWRTLMYQVRSPVEAEWARQGGPEILFALYVRKASLVVMADVRGKLVLLDGRTLTPMVELVGMTIRANGCLATSPDEQFLALGGSDESGRYEVALWDLGKVAAAATQPGSKLLPKLSPRTIVGGEGCRFLASPSIMDGNRSFTITRSLSRDGTWCLTHYKLPAEGESAQVIWSAEDKACLASPTGDLIAVPFQDRFEFRETATGAIRNQILVKEPKEKTFSPDGRFFAVMTEREARIWTVDTATPTHRFPIKDPRTNLFFSPDCRIVALLDLPSGQILIRELDTGREWPLWCHDQKFVDHKHATFSADGQWLLTKSRRNNEAEAESVFWEVSTGRMLRILPESFNETYVQKHCFTPGDTSLLSWSQHYVRRYSLGMLNEPQPIEYLPTAWSAAFSPQGSTLLTGDDDGKIGIWEPKTRKLIREVQIHSGTVSALSFNRAGNLLLSSSLTRSKNLALWDVETGQVQKWLEGHRQKVRCVAFHPDETRIASGADDHQAMIWDLKTGEPLKVLQHRDRVRCMAFSPDGRTLVTGCEDGQLRFWDVESGNLISEEQGGQEVTALAYHPEGTALAWGNNHGRVVLRDLSEEKRADSVILTSVDQIWSMSYSPDGKTLAVGGDSGSVQLICSQTGCQLLMLEGTSEVRGIAIAPDSSSLVIGRLNSEMTIHHALPAQP